MKKDGISKKKKKLLHKHTNQPASLEVSISLTTNFPLPRKTNQVLELLGLSPHLKQY